MRIISDVYYIKFDRHFQTILCLFSRTDLVWRNYTVTKIDNSHANLRTTLWLHKLKFHLARITTQQL